MSTELQNDLALCKSITQRHGRSFSAGIRWFPERIRSYTYAVYGFVRVPDDIVDEEGRDDDDARQALEQWRDDWRRTLATGTSPHAVQRAFYWAMRENDIPAAWPESFLEAMIQDTRRKTYATYRDLEEYMYGSATVVGFMMARLCGVAEGGLPYARALAEAFQMTNFLRDVEADWRERGRIYLPEEDHLRFDLSHEAVRTSRCDARWERLMRFEIERTRALYRFARQGIGYLQPDCRFGVALAADIYEALLGKIEAAHYDVFAGRVCTSRVEKVALLGRRMVKWENGYWSSAAASAVSASRTYWQKRATR